MCDGHDLSGGMDLNTPEILRDTYTNHHQVGVESKVTLLVSNTLNEFKLNLELISERVSSDFNGTYV